MKPRPFLGADLRVFLLGESGKDEQEREMAEDFKIESAPQFPFSSQKLHPYDFRPI